MQITITFTSVPAKLKFTQLWLVPSCTIFTRRILIFLLYFLSPGQASSMKIKDRKTIFETVHFSCPLRMIESGSWILDDSDLTDASISGSMYRFSRLHMLLTTRKKLCQERLSKCPLCVYHLNITRYGETEVKVRVVWYEHVGLLFMATTIN